MILNRIFFKFYFYKILDLFNYLKKKKIKIKKKIIIKYFFQ